MMADYAIRTHGLTKRFARVTAVDDLTLEIPRGIVFAFLGPNGAGKTTTIHLLLGLHEITAGGAEVLGYDLEREPEKVRDNIGALLEHNGLYERMSAEDNLELYGRINRLDVRTRKERIRDLLTTFGLRERRKDRVGTWSRGMKQKLAVARTLLHRPPLIFLDEPTAGLDPVAAAALRDDLAKLVADEGLTVFLTTHNLSEAEKLANLVGVINKGRLVTVGSPDELGSRRNGGEVTVRGTGFTDALLDSLRTRGGVRSIRRRDDGIGIVLEEDASMAPVVRHLVENGAGIEEVRRERESLEEAFLAIMEEKNDA